MEQRAKETLSGRWALAFLGVACAVGVASLYYNQPLLTVMGSSLGQSARAIGFVAVATQVGYAAGLLFLVPLGDVAERRSLMTRMYAGVSVALLLAGLAHGLASLIAASVLIGLMASVTHVALPMAPDLVPHERRGQAIGTVMTGLLLGILLARTFAGWLSRLTSWRTVFFVAAVMNAFFVPVIYRAMPRMQPRQTLTYRETMRSLWTLYTSEPLLREAGVVGGLVFASFSCFWTTIAFLLQARYGMGPGVAGTFGVVGAAGALVAPFAGRVADRRGTRYVVSAAGAVLTASYICLWLSERLHASTAMHMFGLVIGVIVLDVGAQMMQVANQTRIFGLGADARSRLNTIYMTLYFIGGAIGSALATLAWSRWQWNGVFALEMCLIAAAGVRHVTGFSRRHPHPALHVPTTEQEPA
ncbi:MAG TPA: MFS transporter [Acidobacteriaceae bacterium]|nr:MFS transporter [Acidobacteriaceae bacterium]